MIFCTFYNQLNDLRNNPRSWASFSAMSLENDAAASCGNTFLTDYKFIENGRFFSCHDIWSGWLWRDQTASAQKWASLSTDYCHSGRKIGCFKARVVLDFIVLKLIHVCVMTQNDAKMKLFWALAITCCCSTAACRPGHPGGFFQVQPPWKFYKNLDISCPVFQSMECVSSTTNHSLLLVL